MAAISKKKFLALISLLESQMPIAKAADILGESIANVERAATFYYAAKRGDFAYLIDGDKARKYPAYARMALETVPIEWWIRERARLEAKYQTLFRQVEDIFRLMPERIKALIREVMQEEGGHADAANQETMV